MNVVEYRYRRVLRLLPAGYRKLWEEDMVSAFLSSVGESPRRSPSERLAVVWLALRLRLNGPHASPRAAFWYQLVLGTAILTALYESIGAAAQVSIWAVSVDPARLDWRHDLLAWWPVAGLVWVATFACLVLGRLVAARVLVVVALAHDLTPAWLDVSYSTGGNSSIGYGPPTAAQWAWLLCALLAVFLAPTGLRLSRWWLAVCVVPAVVIVLITVAPASTDGRPPTWFEVLEVSVGTILRLGTIAGMIVALVRARRWLFPLAVFGAGTAATELQVLLHLHDAPAATLWQAIDVLQLMLAVACAVVGVVSLRRLPRLAR